MRGFHSIWAVLALLAVPASAQPPPGESSSSYVIFLGGNLVGREDVSIRRDEAGTTITSQGRTNATPAGAQHFAEIRYLPTGAPELAIVDGTADNAQTTLRTNVKDGTASTQGVARGSKISTTGPISTDAVLVPSGVFGALAALGPRLAKASPGDQLHIFMMPGAEVVARVVSVADDRMQTGTSTFPVRRHELSVAEPSGEIVVNITTTADGGLVRVAIPSQQLDVLREDMARANARIDIFSIPGDEQVQVPSLGFSLGATITVPTEPAAPPGGRRPAAVLITGPTSIDRDHIAPNASVMAQLAAALSARGFIVVRYDNRGSGQSGGRTEAAGLADYAEDARAVIRWLASRKDVDRDRIAVIGHGQGAWIALLTASREGRVSAVVTLAAPAAKGDELVLEQQRLQLDRLKLSDSDRAAREELQKKINAAVLTGRGWEDVPEDLRRDADTNWFKSFLSFDPLKVVQDIDEPILVVHGELDREVPVAHAERLAEAAQAGDSESVALVTVKGINHLLLPAFTGEPAEYPTLADRNLSMDVARSVSEWLEQAIPARTR